MDTIIKSNGKRCEFDPLKIRKSILAAQKEYCEINGEDEKLAGEVIDMVVIDVYTCMDLSNHTINTRNVSDIVVQSLKDHCAPNIANFYKKYKIYNIENEIFLLNGLNDLLLEHCDLLNKEDGKNHQEDDWYKMYSSYIKSRVDSLEKDKEME